MRLDLQLKRFRESRRQKSNNSTPFYTVNYDSVLHRPDLGVPDFKKVLARKEMTLITSCLNEYQVDWNSKALSRKSNETPIFSKMFGRNTLNSTMSSPIEFSRRG